MLTINFLNDDYCHGVFFSISDEDALAQAVALVLVQEFTLAKAILNDRIRDVEAETVILDKNEIEDIIIRRLKPTVNYHRDGFLFQLMMWLAAHLDLDNGDLVALPHAQASAKGQDSIVVHRADGAMIALSICEDKATEHPRDTIRKDVWPEIQNYEAGGRLDELRSNIIATLGLGGVPADEAIALVRRISWEGKRRYRVRITVQEERSQQLFKGFNELVSGNIERRRGETVNIPDLRTWMNMFSEKVETELRSYIQEE